MADPPAATPSSSNLDTPNLSPASSKIDLRKQLSATFRSDGRNGMSEASPLLPDSRRAREAPSRTWTMDLDAAQAGEDEEAVPLGEDGERNGKDVNAVDKRE